MTVGAFDAKTRLPALLERVQNGERITITKHGVPVAMLVPVHTGSAMTRKETIEAIRTFGRGHSLPKGMTVRDLIAEGRRF